MTNFTLLYNFFVIENLQFSSYSKEDGRFQDNLEYNHWSPSQVVIPSLFFAQPSLHAEKTNLLIKLKKIRKIFPESWIWDNVNEIR